MFLEQRDELYRSSILKLLIWFAIGLFLVMGLIIYQLYSTSVQLYNHNLDEWLRAETAQLQAIVDTEGVDAIQQNINNTQGDSRYIYQFVHHASPTPTNTAATAYPVIAQIKQSSTNTDLPDMRATKINLPDGSELVVGIDQNRYQSFKKQLDSSVIWGTFFPFIALCLIAILIAVYILKRLNLVNATMNRVMLGERNVRLKVGPDMNEFDLLALHLNSMLEQMEQSESKLKSLTVDIAHDLRTPMGRIKLRIEDLLYDESLSQQHTEQLDNIQSDFSLLLETFNGMMELYHLENGGTPINKEMCDLSKIVRDAIEFAEPTVADKKQTLHFTEEMPCLLYANPSLIFRAVFNIIDNAIKYTHEGGVIEVIVDCFGVVVADNGRGIKPEDRERALGQLVRLDPSRTQHGFGLGLALVNTVMKLHDGQICLSDNYPGLRARLLFQEKLDPEL
ncbi:sensor histidine kinase [Aliivibrio fischeri]|uniref:HAMP domain-containing sensor histidine kinase n=1 Tax=Aliivibrio fischeri TaxID=668 RepID=UPI0012D9178B|nr:HAMP domain-containing sensor histidine kinase [Aliivibrio fischeri]MUK32101.1 sensor histidine kinase [Aliivibrio fischeri]MUL17480.1 sensor histidine kinase [Aliivibrio fischeri]